MIKISVVGAGYWGKNLVRNFHALGALHSICDTDAERLEAWGKDYPDVRRVSAYSGILKDTEIQAVAIATPAETHANLVREALLAGKDVYVEKPLCLTVEEGIEINRLAKQEGRILMVGHLLWYHPAVLRLKDLIDSGELGRIQYIYSNRLNIGKIRREENILWSFAPHDISVILGLLREMPEQVQSQGGNYLHQKIADTTVSLLSFPSGVKAHIYVSWLHPFKEQKLVVVGDQKMAVFDDTATWEEKLALYPHRIDWKGNVPVAHKADVEFVQLKQQEPLRAECVHFLECVKNRKIPRTDGAEGLRVLRVLEQCQRALENSVTVSVHRVDTIKKDSHDYFVHETAVVDGGVEVGAGTKIWHFSHILSGSIIGPKCNIGQNVVIGPNVTVGAGCKIQNNVSLYEGVTMEDDVFCGPSAVFTNVFNPRAAVIRKSEYRQTFIKKGVTIGANATVICGITIGRFAFIGAGAVVTRDVPDYALVMGNPARHAGWMCKCGIRLQFEGRLSTCNVCGSSYKMIDNKVCESEG